MNETQNDVRFAWERPAELLARLLRFDTTNPPGNEGECIAYIDDLLQRAGIATTLPSRSESRPNLIARLPGSGDAPPLLLYGHVDVVTTAHQRWTYPPFSGTVADGCIWGRGALDMKGGVAMMIAALLKARAEGTVPAGDVVLAVLSDEEAGSGYGAQYLVEHHSERFSGIRYAIGEFGGFSVPMGAKRVYPIQVAEKQICWMKITITGPGGHGSQPMRDGAIARLGRILTQLNRHDSPVHITEVARALVDRIARELPFPRNILFRTILFKPLTRTILRHMGPRARYLEPMFGNTVNATIVRGGEKVNVIPSRIEVELDGRLLPGQTPEDMIRELHTRIGEDTIIEIVSHDPCPAETDLGLFDTLADILCEMDELALPVPFLLPGVTDARFFARLGIQTYGFLPTKLEGPFDFISTVHGENERIPIAGLEFGVHSLHRLIERYGK